MGWASSKMPKRNRSEEGTELQRSCSFPKSPLTQISGELGQENRRFPEEKQNTNISLFKNTSRKDTFPSKSSVSFMRVENCPFKHYLSKLC